MDYSGMEIGRYRVLEPLGQGGMAVVYKAFDQRLERDVAVKVIRTEEFAPVILKKVLQRFEREAKTLGRLNHPNIVPIIDFGEQDGAPYLVMPYFKAGTLKEILGRPFEASQAADLLLPLADALAYAHSKGVLHRDIKPANILLTEGGLPMLTDFGIAKLLEGSGGQTITGTGVGIFTPEYMAPEQGMGYDVDERADMYALGVVFYELITGCKPYTADTPMAVMIKHIHDPLPRPKDLVPDLPDRVDQFLTKILAKLPENRYQTMGELKTAISRLVERKDEVQPPSVFPVTHGTQELEGSGVTVELGTGLKPEYTEIQQPAYAVPPQTLAQPKQYPTIQPAAAPSVPRPTPAYYMPFPPPKPRRKIRWWWIVLGLYGLCLILMVILPALLNTVLSFIVTPASF